MIKKLVAFGCSWTFGDELNDPELAHEKDNPRYWDMNTPYRLAHTYPGLIAKHYGLEYENHAFPGASLVSMRDAMTWYVANHDVSDTFFVIGLTETWRWSWHNANHQPGLNDPEWNRHVNSSWMLHSSGSFSESWQQTFRSYMEDQLCEELQKKNLEQTLLFFDGISARYKVPMIQLNMLDVIPGIISVPTHVWPDTKIREWLETNFNRREVLAAGNHPNEKGHYYIADKIFKYIDDKSLLI
jgi:hypothetical protein